MLPEDAVSAVEIDAKDLAHAGRGCVGDVCS